jgi:hypothetical protein
MTTDQLKLKLAGFARSLEGVFSKAEQAANVHDAEGLKAALSGARRIAGSFADELESV